MHAVYRLNERELDEKFLAALKALFAGKQIQIVITEQENRTPFPLRSNADSRRLLEAIEYLDEDQDLITVDVQGQPVENAPFANIDPS